MDDDIYANEDSKEPVIVTFFGPFPSSPALSSFLESEVKFPVWQGPCFPFIAKPEAIVMLHPIVRNYYHIRQIEERTGRVAIARMGYIELVKP